MILLGRAVPRAAVATAGLLCCGALVTGCGAESGGGGDARPSGKPTASPAALPVWKGATAPVPRGDGSKLGSDLNGDGYGDLLLSTGQNGMGAFAVVYGSKDGLDPATRTVFTDAGPAPRSTGDLDGDGYADLVVTPRTAPGIVWGGPGGPDPAAAATPLPEPGGRDFLSAAVTAGDFDGDGHTDLALRAVDDAEGSSRRIEVRYGPFGRDGAAARTDTSYQLPPGSYGNVSRLIAADVNGDAATDLVATPDSDGEQVRSVLMFGARQAGGRFPAAEHTLPLGSAVTAGDFDGDGLDDLAVGDDGSRNTEDDGGGGRVDLAPIVVAHGARGSFDEPATRAVPGSDGLGLRLAAADLDDDGKAELITQYASDLDAIMPADLRGVVVLRGTDDGPGGEIRTLDVSGPERYAGRKLKPYDRRVWVSAGGSYGPGGSGQVVISWGYKSAPAQWWVIGDLAGQKGFVLPAATLEHASEGE
ncbi:FG-GAP repeat domain-containing protein [Streptomyces sp. KL116D]|uniref:FG-GAP repeat domain-containing protein n=1 Tax=Streptomyces sp. KL116D TaxID=3045152 RepID=UPI0035564B66